MTAALGESSSTLQQQPPQWLQHLTSSMEAKFNTLSQSMSAMESVIVTESSRREDSQLRLYAQLSLQGETLVAIERKVLRLETRLQQFLTNNTSSMTQASSSIQRSAASLPMESSSSPKVKSPSRRKITKNSQQQPSNASLNMPLSSVSVASGVNVTDFIMEDMEDMKSGTSASIVSRLLDDNNEPPAGNACDRPQKRNTASTTASLKPKRGRPPKQPIVVAEAVPTATTPGKRKRGRPRIYPIGVEANQGVEVNQPEQPSATVAIASTTTAESGRKKRGPYKKWSEGDNYKAIEKALGISLTGTEGKMFLLFLLLIVS